jgi:gas vesicle protein
MNQREEEYYVATSLISFLAGSILGAGIALLFAPQPGEYTRREMKEKAERAIIRIHRMEDEIKDSINDLIHSIRHKASQMLDEGRDMADSKKREILEAISAGKAALDQERRRLENDQQKA